MHCIVVMLILQLLWNKRRMMKITSLQIRKVRKKGSGR